MCGILGIADQSNIGSTLIRGIAELYHRGPNAWGVAIVRSGQRVRLFRAGDGGPHLRQLTELSTHNGQIGIAHSRYATTTDKTDLARDAQPLVDEETGLSLAFNGHVQMDGLREELEREGVRFRTDNDGELLLNCLLTDMLPSWPTDGRVDYEVLFQQVLRPAVERLMRRLHGRGAYAVVGMLGEFGLFAFRDPHGFRPLMFATDARSGPANVFSSETVALEALGDYERIRPLAAGELIYVSPNSEVFSAEIAHDTPAFCALESVYFAAPDSFLGGLEVDQLRRQLGAELATTFGQLKKIVDVVVPVPETANPAAYELAFRWQKPIGGMAKAIGVRSFLEPSQARREMAADRKYKYFSSFLRNKSVALVDDTVVRGTTMRKVIDELRQHGAREVHVLVTFPPVLHPCYYGIDLPSAEDLLAAQLNDDVEKIRQAIKADSLSYLSESAIRRILAPMGPLCMACANGNYAGGNPAEALRGQGAWRHEHPESSRPSLPVTHEHCARS